MPATKSVFFVCCLCLLASFLFSACADDHHHGEAASQDDDTSPPPADDDTTVVDDDADDDSIDDDATDDDAIDDDSIDDDSVDDDAVDDDSVDDDTVDDDTVVDDDSATPERPWFYDEQNRVVIYHGAEIIQETPPYLSWHTAADYDRLVDWGLNVIRLGIVWEAVEPEQGVYDENFLSQLDERIAWCRERGIGVILELHQDVYSKKYAGDGAPDWACLDNGIPFYALQPWFLNYLQPAVMAAFDNFWANTSGIQDAFIAMWTHLAERYADEPAVTGYDLFNEPFFGTYLIGFDRRVLTPFYQKLIASMQTVDPNHLYFAEPTTVAGTGLPCFLTQFDLPHVAYAPHLYPFLPNILNVYLGNPGEIEHILDGIDWTAGNMKAPVWVGEWALFNAGTINADLYMQDMTRLLDEHLASWSYWIYNKDGNVGLLDADGNERAWVLDKVSRPYPQRTAGFPVNYSFDLDTKHFEMTWNENPPATGPTEIYVPNRHYPNGFTVTCSDAPGAWSYEWDDARQMLSVTADRTIASHTLTIEAK